MSLFDAVRAALDQVEADVEAALADRGERILELERQLAALRPAITWGSSIWVWPGETKDQALARTQKALGPLGLIRHFDSGTPDRPTWTGDTPLHISFKLPPGEVLTGKHDAALKAFFASLHDGDAWTFWHEPEDNIAKGEFTAAQFRDAWRRIDGFAGASGRRLRAVPVFMEWTLNPKSGRVWRDYYPGDAYVDAIGWDAYLLKDRAIADVFAGPRRIATETGRPYLIAETGVAEDQVPAGMTREQALTALARDLATVEPRPVSVTYFDAPVGANSKLWPITRSASASAAWKAGQG